MNKDKFKVGDYVICKKEVSFCDGTFHKVGCIYKVEENTFAYYNYFPEIYDFINKELKSTSEEWVLSMNCRILDYDGWKTKHSFYFDKISFQEFLDKLNISTVQYK